MDAIPAIDFIELRRRHGNLTRAMIAVVPWDEFEAAARDLVAADAELQAALEAVWVAQAEAVPPADRYPAFLAYADEPVRGLFALTNSDAIPCRLHPTDLRFSLAYGKQRRNPLGHMARRAKELRSAASRMRTRLEALALSSPALAPRDP
jgi:hypothetical protein